MIANGLSSSSSLVNSDLDKQFSSTRRILRRGQSFKADALIVDNLFWLRLISVALHEDIWIISVRIQNIKFQQTSSGREVMEFWPKYSTSNANNIQHSLGKEVNLFEDKVKVFNDVQAGKVDGRLESLLLCKLRISKFFNDPSSSGKSSITTLSY